MEMDHETLKLLQSWTDSVSDYSNTIGACAIILLRGHL